jgi:cytochrome oxidase Cu insertion factor (SCO1/SenC/PrrC family)
MSSKKELWILLASFVLPIALGTAFFYLSPTFFTKNTVNYGEFVNPIITTTESDIIFSNPQQDSLQGVWTLAYVSDNCAQTCRQTLENMQTIRILTNENMRRIQSLLITNNAVQDIDLRILRAHASTDLLHKLRKFPQNRLFLIDPLGNIMLHYNPEGLVIKRVMKDLKRLFKYSRIG